MQFYISMPDGADLSNVSTLEEWVEKEVDEPETFPLAFLPVISAFYSDYCDFAKIEITLDENGKSLFPVSLLQTSMPFIYFGMSVLLRARTVTGSKA